MTTLFMDEKQKLHSGARFSLCERYRYKLWRIWEPGSKLVAFVGLNPSTADDVRDDPTVRRCIRFARRWGMGGMYMLNIFGLRSTDPKALYAADDPEGDGNEDAIRKTLRHVEFAVACWGSHGAHLDQGQYVRNKILTGRVRCFGLTQGGQPKHPLYLRADSDLVEMPYMAGRG
jgi:hypothetical protein